MKLIKQDDRGKVYQAEGFKVFYRNKGTTSGNNTENVEELICLISGSAEITLEDSTRTIEAPDEIMFPANTYHKIDAITDIIFILKE